MRVLHVYPKGKPLLASYVSMLSEALKDSIEIMSADNTADAVRICKEQHPDIVHYHGCKTIDLRSSGIRQIQSPHGNMSVVQPVDLTIARSDMEAERIKALWTTDSHKGGHHYEIIRNPLLTKTVSVEETAKRMLHIYQKIVDSNVWELMNEATKSMLSAALKAGICGDGRWVASLPQIDMVHFRQVFIYAYYENVSDIVDRGLDILGIHGRQKPSEYSVYLPSNFKMPTSQYEKSIEEMLLDIKENGLTLIRLTDIARYVFNNDIDEDKLQKQLKYDNSLLLFSSIMQMLKERLNWDEGMMPCVPSENQDTQKIRMQIDNHLNL